jgi:hypothetical protein
VFRGLPCGAVDPQVTAWPEIREFVERLVLVTETDSHATVANHAGVVEVCRGQQQQL